jgi:hypothetical protein
MTYLPCPDPVHDLATGASTDAQHGLYRWDMG